MKEKQIGKFATYIGNIGCLLVVLKIFFFRPIEWISILGILLVLTAIAMRFFAGEEIRKKNIANIKNVAIWYSSIGIFVYLRFFTDFFVQ